ncbi:OrdA protein [Coprinopsis cinerea okayama7|uniref:OrdA protein n=1 Tax=Coprinopsis cinerea (strain Okayama-7 / 130 / ATCC MYA-4618 / FGSC 9003) TaxID=240176 RepID=A8P699_COPC7|nr:OrdA protein [Coprinopsis cinerea okayama7\|eukprot:XP_001839110.2 OrdA protein [Coprinopsis cinerea okayama7\
MSLRGYLSSDLNTERPGNLSEPPPPVLDFARVVSLRLTAAILALVVLFLGRLVWNSKWEKRYPFPPGPHARDIDLAKFRANPGVTFMEWAKSYGPIISYSLRGQRTIVLNSPKAVTDLLETKSSIYSDRPINWMAGELAGRKWNVFSISSQHPRFKIYRRLLHNGLNPRASKDYRAIQHSETMCMLKTLATNPEDFIFALRRSAVATMLKLAYGFQIGGRDDTFESILEETFKVSVELGTPGKYLIESYPWLRFVPAWFPGAGFKRYALGVKEKLDHMNSIPFQWTLRRIRAGNHVESFISKLLSIDTPYIDSKEKEDVLKWCAFGLYIGGGDTTVSALTTFMLIMQLHPDVQRRAHADISRVCQGRLPTPDDYKSLPYIEAIIKEILRWGPVAPLGLPHCATRDEIYEGYYIPKGTKILANIW